MVLGGGEGNGGIGNVGVKGDRREESGGGVKGDKVKRDRMNDFFWGGGGVV